MEGSFEGILAREPIFAVTADVDWASEACISHLMATFEASAIKPTVFVTHASAALSRCQDRGITELAIHPNFLPGTTHGDTLDGIVAHVKALVPAARGSRSHAYAMSSHIIRALRPHVEYDSGPMAFMNVGLRPIYHAPGFVRYPVFWEDDAHWEIYDDWDLARVRPAFETPGLKIIDVHPFFFALNVPNNDFYVRHKAHIQTLSKDEMIERRFSGRGCADLTTDLLSWISSSGYRCMCLADLHDWNLRQDTHAERSR